MELQDLVITPILIIIVIFGAYLLRKTVTDPVTRPYFLPALIAKIAGAIALGLVYQFYYGWGDTFMYHTYGSRFLWNALQESPVTWFKLLVADGVNQKEIYTYSSQIYFFRDQASYNIIRFAAVMDLFTFSTYSGTAVMFSILSFTGSWFLFLTFYKQYPYLHREFAWAILFVPSVIFWGSGILKDTITLACLGVSTYCIYRILIERRPALLIAVMLLATLYVIYGIKPFILQAFLPASIFWIMARNFARIKSLVMRVMMVPFAIVLILASAYFAVAKVGENNARYSVDKIAATAQITAYDIRFFSGRAAGSGYTLDVQDWTPVGMLSAAPAAINVALFRPYLWEVRNPLMFLSALESTFLFLFLFYVIFKNFRNIFSATMSPNVMFCLIFSLTFAFATGISTFNFGTLARYRIPLVPFFLVALILMRHFPFRTENKADDPPVSPEV